MPQIYATTLNRPALLEVRQRAQGVLRGGLVGVTGVTGVTGVAGVVVVVVRMIIRMSRVFLIIHFPPHFPVPSCL